MPATQTQTAPAALTAATHARPHKGALTYCRRSTAKVESVEVLPYAAHLAGYLRYRVPCLACAASAKVATEAKTAENNALATRVAVFEKARKAARAAAPKPTLTLLK